MYAITLYTILSYVPAYQTYSDENEQKRKRGEKGSDGMWALVLAMHESFSTFFPLFPFDFLAAIWIVVLANLVGITNDCRHGEEIFSFLS